MLGWLRHQVSLRLRHKNPFVDHAQHPDRDGSVLTFEINWSSIVGMDFKWPLTDDPRLVLEAAVMSKRVFDTVSECVSPTLPHQQSWTPATAAAIALHCWRRPPAGHLVFAAATLV